MLRIQSSILRTTGALLVAATVLSADAFAAPMHSGSSSSGWGGWGNWGGWGGWHGSGVASGQQGPADTPEINPALIGGAITLLLGGALILTDMLRNKKPLASN